MQAYNSYVEDGVAPVKRYLTSQFKGVCWSKAGAYTRPLFSST